MSDTTTVDAKIWIELLFQNQKINFFFFFLVMVVLLFFKQLLTHKYSATHRPNFAVQPDFHRTEVAY